MEIVSQFCAWPSPKGIQPQIHSRSQRTIERVFGGLVSIAVTDQVDISVAKSLIGPRLMDVGADNAVCESGFYEARAARIGKVRYTGYRRNGSIEVGVECECSH